MLALPLAMALCAGALISKAPESPAFAKPSSVHLSQGEADLGAWMERLRAGTAPERDAAQRWLASNLELHDYGLFAAAAREADPEAERRLVGALGSDGAHLGLVVLLCGEADEGLRAIGERAFDELVARWCPQASNKPVSRVRVNSQVVKSASREFIDRPRSELAREGIDRIARLSDLELPIVLAPKAALKVLETDGLEGSTLEVLTDTVKAAKLSYSGVGDWSGEYPGRGAWILVTASGGARRQSGVQRLLSWCSQVEGAGRSAADAARALGATAWPAALSWLEWRWIERRDANALEGLLIAAQRGRVSTALMSPIERKVLLRRADTALAAQTVEGRREASRIARALAAAPALGFGGVDSSMTLFDDWEELGEASRWVRLAVLEGARSGRGDVQRRLLEVVEGESTASSALRIQALRTLAASPRLPLRPVRVDDLPTLVRYAFALRLNDELLELLDVLAVEVDIAALDGSDAQRAFAAHWSLRRGDDESVVRTLIEHVSERQPEADLLAPEASSWIARMTQWRLLEGRVALQRVVGAALDRLDEPARGRLAASALLAGGLDAVRERELYMQLSSVAQPSALQFELLGALCGGPVRRLAQADLYRHLATPPAQADRRAALARGLDRAVAELRARRRDAEASELRKEVWRISFSEYHPMHQLLSIANWPSEGGAVMVRVDVREREVPSAE